MSNSLGIEVKMIESKLLCTIDIDDLHQTGFLCSSDGLILTAGHGFNTKSIAIGDKVKITLFGKKSCEARLIECKNEEEPYFIDYALLKMNGKLALEKKHIPHKIFDISNRINGSCIRGFLKTNKSRIEKIDFTNFRTSELQNEENWQFQGIIETYIDLNGMSGAPICSKENKIIGIQSKQKPKSTLCIISPISRVVEYSPVLSKEIHKESNMNKFFFSSDLLTRKYGKKEHNIEFFLVYPEKLRCAYGNELSNRLFEAKYQWQKELDEKLKVLKGLNKYLGHPVRINYLTQPIHQEKTYVNRGIALIDLDKLGSCSNPQQINLCCITTHDCECTLQYSMNLTLSEDFSEDTEIIKDVVFKFALEFLLLSATPITNALIDDNDTETSFSVFRTKKEQYFDEMGIRQQCPIISYYCSEDSTKQLSLQNLNEEWIKFLEYLFPAFSPNTYLGEKMTHDQVMKKIKTTAKISGQIPDKVYQQLSDLEDGRYFLVYVKHPPKQKKEKKALAQTLGKQKLTQHSSKVYSLTDLPLFNKFVSYCTYTFFELG